MYERIMTGMLYCAFIVPLLTAHRLISCQASGAVEKSGRSVCMFCVFVTVRKILRAAVEISENASA